MKKYQIILADPPWLYADRKSCDPKLGGFKYSPMKLEDICTLPVQAIADKDCALALWVTMPMLKEGLRVIEAWDFKYITCLFNWIKLNPSGSIGKNEKDIILKKGIYSGLGHWVNGNSELCLFGKKGKPKRYEKNVKQIQIYPRARHSQKPPEIRNELVKLFGDLPRIELFAREKTEGWDVWGNECESNITF